MFEKPTVLGQGRERTVRGDDDAEGVGKGLDGEDRTTNRTVSSADLSHYDLPAATHSYLDRSAQSLYEAITSADVPTRYACAHVAALRAAAALLAARARPTWGSRRTDLPARAHRNSPKSTHKNSQKNAWVLLAEVAPELAEWAVFFAAGAAKRVAAEAGSARSVTGREADDLVRDADRFLGVIESDLGLAPHTPISTRAMGARDRAGVA
jgi:SAV_6107-like HEPN